jgi:hypothetical protein
MLVRGWKPIGCERMMTFVGCPYWFPWVAGLLSGKVLTLFSLARVAELGGFCDKKIDRFCSGQLSRTGASGALWTLSFLCTFS